MLGLGLRLALGCCWQVWRRQRRQPIIGAILDQDFLAALDLLREHDASQVNALRAAALCKVAWMQRSLGTGGLNTPSLHGVRKQLRIGALVDSSCAQCNRPAVKLQARLLHYLCLASPVVDESSQAGHHEKFIFPVRLAMVAVQALSHHTPAACLTALKVQCWAESALDTGKLGRNRRKTSPFSLHQSSAAAKVGNHIPDMGIRLPDFSCFAATSPNPASD